MSASWLFPTSLVLLSLALAAALFVGIARVAPEARNSTAGGLVAWLTVPAVLAGAGLLTFESTPPTMLVLLFALFVGTVLFARSERAGRLAAAIPLSVLVGFQGFRVLVELWLHRGYGLGLFPVQMTYSGLNFDIVSGLSAIIVGALVHEGLVGRRTVLAWNVLGLGLLATIVTIALLSAPVPFRVFHEGPANMYVTGFPGVWLPAVLVQGALLGHLLVFRTLLGGAAATAPPVATGSSPG